MNSSFTCSAFKCWSRSQRVGTVLGIIVITILIIGAIWLGFCCKPQTQPYNRRIDEEGESLRKRKQFAELLLESLGVLLGKREIEKSERPSRRRERRRRKPRSTSRLRSRSLSSVGQEYQSSRWSAEPPMILSAGTSLSRPSPAFIRPPSIGHAFEIQDAGFRSYIPSRGHGYTNLSNEQRDSSNQHSDSYWPEQLHRGRPRARTPSPRYDRTRCTTPIYSRWATEQLQPSLSQPRVPATKFHDAEVTAKNVATHILRQEEQRRQVARRRRQAYQIHSPVRYTDDDSSTRLRRTRARR